MPDIPKTARTILDDLEGLWGHDMSAKEIKAKALAERKDGERREGGTPMTTEEIEATEKAHTKMCEEMKEMRDRGRG